MVCGWSQVCSYFLQGYYNVLANSPELACQFYTDYSTAVRLDCQTMKSSFGETVEVWNEASIFFSAVFSCLASVN